MNRQIKVVLLACFLLAAVYGTRPAPVGGKEAPAVQTACPDAREHALPLPSTVPPAQFVAFEQQVLTFLQQGEYKSLGWCMDKGVRDTGPWIKKTYYGTHPAVRIFYSPKMMQWLVGGRRGPIPDGAMTIKEQYPPPAARYAGMSDNQLPAVSDWTVMIRDAAGSNDGWFWGEWYDGMSFDDDKFPFNYPNAGFALYCLRCHSSAENLYTFASLKNIKGFPGQPLVFFDDGSWKGMAPQSDYHHNRLPRPEVKEVGDPDPDFLRVFNSIPPVPLDQVQTLPSETYDRVVSGAQGPGQFLTSEQCMNCHSGLNGPFGPTMFLQTGPFANGFFPGANVSPYGEWRWSPMGLAGRDPIFYAQLESERAYIDRDTPGQKGEQLKTQTTNLCLSCHGVMGKRQIDIDQPSDQNFKLDFIQLTDRSNPDFKYGALARDGVSCTVCHHIAEDRYPPTEPPLQYFLENSITGRFQVTKPDQVFGPFREVSTLPMRNALGIKPEYNRYIQSSRLCGSCHTINLPVVDGAPGQMSIEQATYLEWLNSQYQDEFSPGANARSCQDCHMPGNYHNAALKLNVPQLQEKIATIEDDTYPEAEHRASPDKIRVPVRDQGFVRHTFLGLNVFLLEIFQQFAEVLGVRTADYMSTSNGGLPNAIEQYVEQAQTQTARIAVAASALDASRIAADVEVTNLVGHRFPSGVGFRRAFLEVLVVARQGGAERIVWSSGRTDSLGIIVDGEGHFLPSEFFTEYRDAQGHVRQHYQPHYEVINAQDQAQIYEELTQDVTGQFTTSFVRRDHTIKDNRLLPIGWTKAGPDPSLSGVFLEATFPEGSAALDPDYQEGQGRDRVRYIATLPMGVDPAQCEVRATLNYQSIPPYFLAQRFQAAPDGEATKRLYYLTSNLDLKGTPIEGWKLPVVTASAPVTGQAEPCGGAGLPLTGEQAVKILAPSGRCVLGTGPVNLLVRVGRGINPGSLRAFLNRREITGLFARTSSLACTAVSCELAAVVSAPDGLVAGRNELQVEVRDPGGARAGDARVFVTK